MICRDDISLDVMKQLSGDNMIGFGILRVKRTISGFSKVRLMQHLHPEFVRFLAKARK